MATVVDQAEKLAKMVREVALQSRRIKPVPAGSQGAPTLGIDKLDIRRSEM